MNNPTHKTMEKFFESLSTIYYSVDLLEENKPTSIEQAIFPKEGLNTWINIYGLTYLKEFGKIISLNNQDDFVRVLIEENQHRNKVIELEDTIFLAINTIHLVNNEIIKEQLIFIVGPNFVWSIQEKKGDYFGEIRNRIRQSRGIVRRKNCDYLLYLIIDSIIDNYSGVYEKVNKQINAFNEVQNTEADHAYVINIENIKQTLFKLKKAVSSLREAISKLENCEIDGFETKYFIETKEQAHYLMDNIDFDLNQVESNLNLVLNLQSNRLNQVMKTLTIFSVIFIPLTFIAGLFGMNYKYMPGVEEENGFYIMLGAMIVITLFSVYMVWRKNWFK